jgi:nucleoside-diphosphate-sugar epimerase
LRVSITGGRGRLGRIVANEACVHGHEVVSIDRVSWDGTVREGRDEVEADLMDRNRLEDVLAGSDVVVHLAAELLPTSHCLHSNQQTTWNVLQSALNAGVRRVVFASSVYAYGHHWGFTAEQFPDGYQRFDEREILSVPRFPITERDEPGPWDPYSVSKLLNERSAEAMSLCSRLETVGLRFGDMWFDELRTWWERPPVPTRPRGGEKFDFWNYVDAHDAARAAIASVEATGLPGHATVFVMADDTQVRESTKDALAASFPELLDRLPEGMESRSSLFSNARAKDLLGWSPLVSWRDYEPAT